MRVGVDQFFSFGPDVPFKAHRVFTDREEQLRRLHERFIAHGTRAWPVPELLDFQRAASNVVSVAGDGGIGKSRLVRHAADLAVQGELAGLPPRRACAVLDFGDPSNSSFETVLLRVRAALGSLVRSWPAFDVALAVYWERKHPGESLTAFLSKAPSADATRLAEQVAETVEQMLGGFGAVTVAYRVISMLGRTAAQKARLKRLREELPALDPILSEEDPDRMLGYMPVLLAADLERVRARRPTLAVCVLDTLENIQSLPNERGGLEDLVSRLVYLMPNVMFVAASRLPLRWHDPVRAVGLTYGGAHRWPGLAGSDQVDLTGFDAEAAEAYLVGRLTVDGEPAIDAPVRARIMAGSNGSPLYLELSAGLYEQYLARRETPPPDAFGQGFPELVLRTMRDLSETDRDLLRAAALLEAFDAETLSAVLPTVRRRQVENFVARTFVRKDDTVWPPYRLHENLRRSVLDCDAYTDDGWSLDERRERAWLAVGHLGREALAVWDDRHDYPIPQTVRSQRTVAAFLLALRAAHEHSIQPPVLGEMAYSLSVLGHWQVLASLPELTDTPELAKLTGIARLTARGQRNAVERYEAMRDLVGDPAGSPFADYFRHELGNLGHIIGRLDEAIGYTSAIAADGSLIGTAALFGSADNALRRCDYRQVVELMDKASDASLDRVRVADILGHTYIQNARFSDAAAQFEITLNEARTANAPLWEARAVRHLALALMWHDPDRALELIPEARELNQSVGELIGVAQCDMAESMARALQGEQVRASELLDAAERQFEELGATGELLPAVAVRVLQHAAFGELEQASILARSLHADAADGSPGCLPAWIVVAGWWTCFARPAAEIEVTWLDGAEETRRRWLAVLERLEVRAGAGRTAEACGRLDVEDAAGLIATDPVSDADLARSMAAALLSPAFDGPGTVPTGRHNVIHGDRTVAKFQHRSHERLETVLRLDRLRTVGVRAPRLLDHGTVATAGDEIWWAVLDRHPGQECDQPTPAQQREVGAQLRRWHESHVRGGLRLDDPGALGVFLGSSRAAAPRVYPALSAALADACAGMPVTPIHGDLAVGHNALFDGDTLTAVLDPGAVEHGPPMIDLAWALAVDLPRGGTPEPLYDGYGRDAVDHEALDALLPLMLIRRLVDTSSLGLADIDGHWILTWLRDHRPDLAKLAAKAGF